MRTTEIADAVKSQTGGEGFCIAPTPRCALSLWRGPERHNERPVRFEAQFQEPAMRPGS